MSKSTVNFHFFSPSDNVEKQAKKTKNNETILSGYISRSGKLVFPPAIQTSLPVSLKETKVRIAVEEGKTKIKKLYILPSTNAENGFPVEETPRGYIISLGEILMNGGVTFDKKKYTFSILSFKYDESIGMQLTIHETENPKKGVEYTGKKRGRKPKSIESSVE